MGYPVTEREGELCDLQRARRHNDLGVGFRRRPGYPRQHCSDGALWAVSICSFELIVRSDRRSQRIRAALGFIELLPGIDRAPSEYDVFAERGREKAIQHSWIGRSAHRSSTIFQMRGVESESPKGFGPSSRLSPSVAGFSGRCIAWQPGRA